MMKSKYLFFIQIFFIFNRQNYFYTTHSSINVIYKWDFSEIFYKFILIISNNNSNYKSFLKEKIQM